MVVFSGPDISVVWFLGCICGGSLVGIFGGIGRFVDRKGFGGTWGLLGALSSERDFVSGPKPLFLSRRL